MNIFWGLIVFTKFFFLVDEKIELKVLACPFELLTNFENPSNNPLQRPYKAAILTLKKKKIAYRKPPMILLNHTRSRL
jgi:hypothetical protein